MRIAPYTTLSFRAPLLDCSTLAAFGSASPSDRSASYAWHFVLVYGLLRTLTRPALVRFADRSAFLSEFRTVTDYSAFDA
jgi:hypothetical protein